MCRAAEWGAEGPRFRFGRAVWPCCRAGRRRPGFDLAGERRRREDAGRGELIEEVDLYPDVRPGLRALREAGLWVGIAGDQTARAAELLHRLDLPVETIATSGEWGVAKPDSTFFDRVIAMAPGKPHEIVYVGDHHDNDVIPAHSAGLRSALIRRGPWGYLWADDLEVRAYTDRVIDSIEELPRLITEQTRRRSYRRTTVPLAWSRRSPGDGPRADVRGD